MTRPKDSVTSLKLAFKYLIKCIEKNAIIYNVYVYIFVFAINQNVCFVKLNSQLLPSFCHFLKAQDVNNRKNLVYWLDL